MTEPPEREDIIDRLNDFLMSDKAPEESMMLSDLDGFLTAIAIGPEPVPPSRWLPVIWGDEEPAFDDLQEAQSIHDAIMFRYNQILAEVERGQPDPILWTNKEGDIIADDWVAGFMQAIDLDPTAWEKLFKAEHMAPYFLPILALASDENGEPLVNMPYDAQEQILEVIDEALILCITEISDFWRKRHTQAHGPKAGRNDPCPCGSGKKFKKCCGANT